MQRDYCGSLFFLSAREKGEEAGEWSEGWMDEWMRWMGYRIGHVDHSAAQARFRRTGPLTGLSGLGMSSTHVWCGLDI